MSTINDIYSTGKPSQFGTFGYYGLLDWWNSEFTTDEKTYIEKKYNPIGSNGLTRGQILGTSASSVSFLTGLQSWFTTLSDEAISEKILKKAEQLVSSSTPIIDVHFLYGAFIEHYYKKRKNNLVFYELAKEYCLKQIELSEKSKSIFLREFGFLPAHFGFKQLAIILEKEHNFREALQICLNAKKQGWNADWNKRIAKLEMKLAKHYSRS